MSSLLVRLILTNRKVYKVAHALRPFAGLTVVKWVEIAADVLLVAVMAVGLSQLRGKGASAEQQIRADDIALLSERVDELQRRVTNLEAWEGSHTENNIRIQANQDSKIAELDNRLASQQATLDVIKELLIAIVISIGLALIFAVIRAVGALKTVRQDSDPGRTL